MYITEQIVRQTAGNFYWKDVNGYYLGCNDNMAKLFKLQHPNEIIGKNDYDFFLDDIHVKKIIENDRLVISSGEEIEFEEVGADETGRLLTYKTKKVPLRDEKNNIIGIIGISIDITKEKEAEITKADFISNMQHDLKTPFAGISAVAMLLYEMETDPEKKLLLEDLLKSCNQWEMVHHQIIAVLSVKEPQIVKKELVSISRELSNIRDEFSATLRVRAIDFFIEPIPDEIDQIETDRLKLGLILSNLIGNAIKFTEKGSVRIKASNENSTCKIEIIDTGLGIPDDKLDFIFEQFTKLSNSNKHSDYKGVGLGLYSARQVASLLGGTIQVKSKLGKGSVFIVTLPCQDKSEK